MKTKNAKNIQDEKKRITNCIVIEAVWGHEFLHNKSLTQYKKTSDKRKKWKELSKETGIADINKVFNKLVSEYRMSWL